MKAKTTMMIEEQTFSKGGKKAKKAGPSEATLMEGDPEFGEENVKLEEDLDEENEDLEALKEKLKEGGMLSFEAAPDKGKGAKPKAAKGGKKGGRGGK
jgi:hypothetical protein